jgi:hypothetical protein
MPTRPPRNEELGLLGRPAPERILNLNEDSRRAGQPVIVTEPIGGPWVNNRKWGDSFRSAFPAGAGQRNGVAALDFTPGPPRVYTVGMLRALTAIASGNCDVRAIITYGVGAVQNSLVCDWISGCHLSLLASYIKVDCITYAPDADAAYSVGATDYLDVSAAFGAGSHGHGPPITYTEPVRELAHSGNLHIIPPEFARAFTLRWYDQATGLVGNNRSETLTSVYAQCVGNGAVADLVSVDSCQFANNSDGMLLPGGTRAVNIVNSSGSTIEYIVQWLLSV